LFALISIILLYLDYTLRSKAGLGEEQVYLWTRSSYHIYLASLNIQIFVYLLLTIRFVLRYVEETKRNYSELSHVRISWYVLVLAIFISHWLFDILTSYSLFWFDNLTEEFELLSLISLLAFATVIIYRGLQRDLIFTSNSYKEKYLNSNITEDEKVAYTLKLEEYMSKEKPYLSPKLSLTELADLVNLQPKYLSQIINESFNCNFFDFVNSYRIKEAKKQLELMKNYGHKTILELLFEVGFNSKSAFNRAFKKQLGLTPTEFKKTQLSTKI
jgi:AraC-like DNA-binding protein